MPVGIRVNAPAPGPKAPTLMIIDPSLRSTGGTRDRNGLELVGETLRVALDASATVAPRWLRQSARGTDSTAMPRG